MKATIGESFSWHVESDENGEATVREILGVDEDGLMVLADHQGLNEEQIERVRRIHEP